MRLPKHSSRIAALPEILNYGSDVSRSGQFQ